MNERAYDRVIRALHEHGSRVRPGAGGTRAEAQCPHHEDRNASMSVAELGDRAVMFCHAGCDTRDIVADLGLTMADLYDERSATYRYGDGRVVRRSYDSVGKKQFQQSGASATSTLYHADRLAAVEPGRTVFLVEGEADVHAIEAAGGVATTAPQGASSFHKADVTPLAGLWVTAVVDRDEAGDKWAAQVADKLDGVAGRYRFVRAVEGKDASEHIAAGHSLGDFAPYTPPASGPTYGDVAALLDGTMPTPPETDVMFRDDGVAMLYSGKVNVLFGDSESGKTWIALAALAEVLGSGGRVAVIDLDHNGIVETVTRLLALGVPPGVLADLDRFRYCEPEDAADLDAYVADLAAWRPWAVAADSLGEILPMLGLSSNSPDEYTIGNRRVLVPLAAAGAAVIAIDHLPKDEAAREKGQTGTMAKRRSINGVSLRVTVRAQFAPGRGGTAGLTISKDRPGGLRAYCPEGKGTAAGVFVLDAQSDGTLTWHVAAPTTPKPDGGAPDEDVAELDSLDPPPRSQRDVQERLRWGSDRAMRALRTWRDLRE